MSAPPCQNIMVISIVTWYNLNYYQIQNIIPAGLDSHGAWALDTMTQLVHVEGKIGRGILERYPKS